jgi:undecaprenyl phosphate N,N'-diacetylbacillosamine 1-phosphate transferase
MYQSFVKRIIDLLLSIILLIIFAPFMIIIFFIIWFTIGFPIFIQKRPGLNNRIFKIYKFKTLYDSCDDSKENERQNKIGDFLRKTGLDELPQLFNIIKNDMSLIGPRPLLSDYLDKYSKEEIKRHLVKPGITGLAQISVSKDGTKSWKKSLKLDVYYAVNLSFSLDFKILCNTIKLILMNKKQYQDFKKFNE